MMRIATAVLFLSWLAPAARVQDADPTPTERLEEEFREAYDRADWTRAVEVGRVLAERRPDEVRHAYDLACVLARSDEPSGALLWLARAAERGFANGDLARRDPDLASLHGEDGWEGVLAVIDKNARAEFAALREAAARSEPLVVVPEGLDPARPAPLIVALHPYGGTAEAIAEVWRPEASELGAILLAPRGLRAVADGFQWGSLEEADVLVSEALQTVLAKHAVDPARTVLTGFSQGGYVAVHHALAHPERFAGVIPVAGFYVPELATLPDPDAGPTPRFFVMIGSEDRSLEASRRLHADLTAAGIPSELAVYEGLGHAFPEDTRGELHRALHFVLLGD